MKIAIESNDGVTLKSPFSQTKGYIVCDIDKPGSEKSEYIQLSGIRKRTHRKTESAFRLTDCRTVISRGMNDENRHLLNEQGIEIFITFNTLVKDALHSYMKEKMISESISH